MEEGDHEGSRDRDLGLRGEREKGGGGKTGVTGGGMILFLVVYPSRLVEEGDLKGAEIET